MLITYLRWLNSGRNALWIASAIWFLALGVPKEHSVVAPAAALLLTGVLRRPSLDLARRLARRIRIRRDCRPGDVGSQGGPGHAYEVYAIDMLAESHGSTPGERARPFSLSVIPRPAFLQYLFLWMVPNPAWMSMDMREPLAQSLLSWPYWAAAVAFICYPLLASAWRSRVARRRRRLGSWRFPWLMFIPELSTVPCRSRSCLYRSYSWFPFFSVIVPLAIERISLRAAALSVAVCRCIRPAVVEPPGLAVGAASPHGTMPRGCWRGVRAAPGAFTTPRPCALGESRREEAWRDMDRWSSVTRGSPRRVSPGQHFYSP